MKNRFFTSGGFFRAGGHSAFYVLFFIFSIVLFPAADLSAQEQRWYDSFFVEGSVHYYLVPQVFSDLIKPDFGFRAALGYEYRRFRFGLETGYTHIAGTNPIAIDFQLMPLVFKAGYALPLRWGFGLQADLSFGFLFYQTIHYESAVDMILDNKQISSTRSPFTGARLYGTYTLPGSRLGWIKFYAGGGLDGIIESDGLIPLPLIEAGISLKPLVFVRPRQRAATQAVVFAHMPENIVIEETEEGRFVRFLNAVYFAADSAAPMEQFLPVLNQAGAQLRANPELRIILRGYTAPFGTAEGRAALSQERAVFCADYLMAQYGISRERMRIEFFGADRVPELAGASWESYRCVELIIE